MATMPLSVVKNEPRQPLSIFLVREEGWRKRKAEEDQERKKYRHQKERFIARFHQKCHKSNCKKVKIVKNPSLILHQCTFIRMHSVSQW